MHMYMYTHTQETNTHSPCMATVFYLVNHEELYAFWFAKKSDHFNYSSQSFLQLSKQKGSIAKKKNQPQNQKPPKTHKIKIKIIDSKRTVSMLDISVAQLLEELVSYRSHHLLWMLSCCWKNPRVIYLDTCLVLSQFGKLDHNALDMLECQPLHFKK